MAKTSAAHDAAGYSLFEGEVRDCAVLVSGENISPEGEYRLASLQWLALVQRWRWDIFHLGVEEGKDRFEVTPVECVAGSVESGPKDTAAKWLG